MGENFIEKDLTNVKKYDIYLMYIIEEIEYNKGNEEIK